MTVTKTGGALFEISAQTLILQVKAAQVEWLYSEWRYSQPNMIVRIIIDNFILYWVENVCWKKTDNTVNYVKVD